MREDGPERGGGGRVGALLLVDSGALLPALWLSETLTARPHRGLDQVAGPPGGEDLRHRPGEAGQAGQQEEEQGDNNHHY